ncbi:MAG: hypothetical protein HQL57_09935 [Magnetococcales bacterium]|nr:hypothetical protein [Magnetococcales bacterium]
MNGITYGTGSGTLERPEDAGSGDAGVVKRWLLELSLADRQEADWRRRARETIARYRAEEQHQDATFNILFTNVQTLAPALYSETPKADVRRRFHDQDVVGREASEIIERALAYVLEDQDFDGIMNAAVFDCLLCGRAVSRVRYRPHLLPARDLDPESEKILPALGGGGTPGGGVIGEEDWNEPPMPPSPQVDSLLRGEADRSLLPTLQDPGELELVFEEVEFEHVDWRDFRRGPGRRWDEVRWVAFRHFLTRDEGARLFPEFSAWEEIALDVTADGLGQGDQEGLEADSFKRLTVWEFWDKEGREVWFIAPSYPHSPLKREKDPLGLGGFFPIPRPMYAVSDTTTLVPVEEFRLYRDQALELDRVTHRITRIVEVLRVRGIADSSIADLWNMENLDDGQFVPADSVAGLMAQGGLEKALWMFPAERIIQVLDRLYQHREQVKATIYEITGIADILRGNSQVAETATAQSIKSQWGSQRLRRRQREVQRYARDLVRLAGEIIAERFQPSTLTMMTGQRVDQRILAVLRDDAVRSFRLDIETDSTIAGDEDADRRNITQLLGGISGYIQGMGGAVMEGFISPEAAKSILMASIRRFRLGREVEEAMESSGGAPGATAGPSPRQLQQLQMVMAQLQQRLQVAEAAEKSRLVKLQDQQKESAVRLQIEQERNRLELALKERQMQLELAYRHRLAILELELRARTERQKEGLESPDDVGDLPPGGDGGVPPTGSGGGEPQGGVMPPVLGGGGSDQGGAGGVSTMVQGLAAVPMGAVTALGESAVSGNGGGPTLGGRSGLAPGVAWVPSGVGLAAGVRSRVVPGVAPGAVTGMGQEAQAHPGPGVMTGMGSMQVGERSGGELTTGGGRSSPMPAGEVSARLGKSTVAPEGPALPGTGMVDGPSSGLMPLSLASSPGMGMGGAMPGVLPGVSVAPVPGSDLSGVQGTGGGWSGMPPVVPGPIGGGAGLIPGGDPLNPQLPGMPSGTGRRR